MTPLPIPSGSQDGPADRRPGAWLTLVEGSTFCISETNGDVVPGRPQGLFVRDTRVLSRWELTVDGSRPTVLAVAQDDPFAATSINQLPPRDGGADSSLLVVRRRYVGDGMREDIAVRNTTGAPAQCQVDLEVGADFADLFEVKDGRPQHAVDLIASAHASVLRLRRPFGDGELGVAISADGDPTLSLTGLSWTIDLPARAEWTVSIEVTPEVDGQALPLRHPRGTEVAHSMPSRRLEDWRRQRPTVRTSDAGFAATLQRSVEDLGALRIYDPQHPHRAVVAAGTPWYMALFGRDSLLTAWMALPLDTSLALGTLQTLADHQGRRYDAATEEQPGRILHEIRFGPSTQRGFADRSVYYGTVDATPLFVVLLGEVARWTGLTDTITDLLHHADRALEWITEDGDRDGDGFVEYQRSSPTGLTNQGWKDSWDGVNYADGRIAEAPIALAEVQGYCYAAFRARAELAARLDDHDTARRWTARADTLKKRFNRHFWVPERGWFATALDADKQPIDALTSTMGHCLWSGIVDEDRAPAVAEHLLSPDMFSTWGIRTLAASMGAYNPMSYHNGSVWPHDNAICASGLMRYGFTEAAQRVAAALLDAGRHFGHRLPELYCGFGRSDFPAPVPYPASCSPQAWAAAAPIALLRTLLGLDPDVPARQVACSPAVPAALLPLRVTGVRIAAARVDIDVEADGWSVAGLEGSDLEVVGARADRR